VWYYCSLTLGDVCPDLGFCSTTADRKQHRHATIMEQQLPCPHCQVLAVEERGTAEKVLEVKVSFMGAGEERSILIHVIPSNNIMTIKGLIEQQAGGNPKNTHEYMMVCGTKL
jgi:hypothetical protein